MHGVEVELAEPISAKWPAPADLALFSLDLNFFSSELVAFRSKRQAQPAGTTLLTLHLKHTTEGALRDQLFPSPATV